MPHIVEVLVHLDHHARMEARVEQQSTLAARAQYSGIHTPKYQ